MAKDKRTELMKMIANADDRGIENLYNQVIGKSCACNNVSESDITNAAAHVFAEMSVKDPELIILMPIFAHGIAETLKIVFKEV